MNPLQRSNVAIQGRGSRPLVFAHGFGCDQTMWRFVAPAFEHSHRVVLFDHVGCGRSDLSAFDEQRHASLEGWAKDLVDILEAADLRDAVIVGHSVSSMIGLLASNAAPERVSGLVMLAPSPRYLNDPPVYEGGFERSDVDALLDMIESNMLGWADFLAPMAMGEGQPAALVDELKHSLCSIDPYITRRFATATFLSDNRADLEHLRVPSLVVEMSHDAIAPAAVGRYLRQHLPQARFATIQGNGHCPHMTHPAETIELLRGFL
jgi:sigma-B regulation protein RsbQ